MSVFAATLDECQSLVSAHTQESRRWASIALMLTIAGVPIVRGYFTGTEPFFAVLAYLAVFELSILWRSRSPVTLFPELVAQSDQGGGPAWASSLVSAFREKGRVCVRDLEAALFGAQVKGFDTPWILHARSPWALLVEVSTVLAYSAGMLFVSSHQFPVYWLFGVVVLPVLFGVLDYLRSEKRFSWGFINFLSVFRFFAYGSVFMVLRYEYSGKLFF